MNAQSETALGRVVADVQNLPPGRGSTPHAVDRRAQFKRLIQNPNFGQNRLTNRLNDQPGPHRGRGVKLIVDRNTVPLARQKGRRCKAADTCADNRNGQIGFGDSEPPAGMFLAIRPPGM